MHYTETVDENSQEEMDVDDEYKSAEQISDELVTLSLLPTSRWLNLLNLDVIKVLEAITFSFQFHIC